MFEWIFFKEQWTSRQTFSKWKHKFHFCIFFFFFQCSFWFKQLISCKTVFVSRTALVIISHRCFLVLLFGNQVIDIKNHFYDLFLCLVGLPWKPEACIQAFVNRKDILHAVFLFQVCVYIIIFILKPLSQKHPFLLPYAYVLKCIFIEMPKIVVWNCTLLANR